MNVIINGVDYDAETTLTGFFVTATVILDIYADDNDVSETPVLSGIVIGTGKTKKAAYRNAEKDIAEAVKLAEARAQGGA